LTFDQLVRNPKFIAERIVPVIKYVYKMFKDAIDAKTHIPLFTKAFSAKANAVLELG